MPGYPPFLEYLVNPCFLPTLPISKSMMGTSTLASDVLGRVSRNVRGLRYCLLQRSRGQATLKSRRYQQCGQTCAELLTKTFQKVLLSLLSTFDAPFCTKGIGCKRYEDPGYDACTFCQNFLPDADMMISYLPRPIRTYSTAAKSTQKPLCRWSRGTSIGHN